jgi:hypothetical protein
LRDTVATVTPVTVAAGVKGRDGRPRGPHREGIGARIVEQARVHPKWTQGQLGQALEVKPAYVGKVITAERERIAGHDVVKMPPLQFVNDAVILRQYRASTIVSKAPCGTGADMRCHTPPTLSHSGTRCPVRHGRYTRIVKGDPIPPVAEAMGFLGVSL